MRRGFQVKDQTRSPIEFSVSDVQCASPNIARRMFAEEQKTSRGAGQYLIRR